MRGWKLLCQWTVELKWSTSRILTQYSLRKMQSPIDFRKSPRSSGGSRRRCVLVIESLQRSRADTIRRATSTVLSCPTPWRSEALQIDEEIGTNLWWTAIQKELKKVMRLNSTMASHPNRYDRTNCYTLPVKKLHAIWFLMSRWLVWRERHGLWLEYILQNRRQVSHTPV